MKFLRRGIKILELRKLLKEEQKTTAGLGRIQREKVNLMGDNLKLKAKLLKAELEKERLKKAYFTVNEEICQTLGKVLGYPWFKDDLKNFPDATEKDGVCVGEHVAETIAEEAADRIKKLRVEYDDTFTGLLGSSRGECIDWGRRARQPEIDKLQNIIKEYGEHKETCYKRWFDQSFDWICTCGFEKKPCPKCNDSGFIGGPVGYDCPICTKEK